MKLPPSNRPRRSSGFTLIELLVVVAIIGLLLSILLPALGQAKAQARQLLCNTHLRSMGQAALLYADEHNDWLARHNDDDGRMHFAAAFAKYLGHDGRIKELWKPDRFGGPLNLVNVCRTIPQYQCPAHPKPKQQLDYIVNGFPWPYTKRHADMDVAGGGQNGDKYRGQTGDHWVNFTKLEDFGRANPARYVYVIEGHFSLPWKELRYHDLFYTSQLPFGRWPRIANDRRHPGGINAMFFDGHAQTLTYPQVDSGWPNSIGHRLRIFAPVAPELF